MKKQEKKIYRPITGQRWYEKFLDWATREETYRRLVVLPLSYGGFLLFGGLFLAKLANLPIILYAALGVWVCLFLNTLLFATIGALGGGWELRVQKKLRKRVYEYISAHEQSTYNELVEHCMPLKIHLGIDYALEIMFDHRELVSEEVVREPVARIVAVGANEIERHPLTVGMGRNYYTYNDSSKHNKCPPICHSHFI